MFTIAARYLDDVDTVVNNEKENGTAYLAGAQKVLSKRPNYPRLCGPLFSTELHRQSLPIQQDTHHSVPPIAWNQGIWNWYVSVLALLVPGVNLRPGSMEQGWLYMAMAKAMVNATQSPRNVYDTLTTALSGS